MDEAVRIFLFDQLVIEMDGALQKASLSVRNPVQAQDEWACVGVSKGIVWVDPLGPDPTAPGTYSCMIFRAPGYRVGTGRHSKTRSRKCQATWRP